MSFYSKQKLGKYIDILSGFAFKSKDFSDKGIPVIKIKNITPPCVTLNDLTYVPYSIACQNPKYILKKGDILIAMTGSHINQMASVVGRVGRVLYDDITVLNQRVGKIISIDEDNINIDYVYYFLSQYSVKVELAQKAGGAANQANISPSDIKNLRFPYPPINIQSRIVEILFRYDSLIENYQKQIKLLEEAAQRLYKEWFVDLRFPGYENTKIVDGVPEGWKKVFLTELIEPQYGKDHKSLSDGLIPLYGSGGIMRYVNKVLYSGESVLIPRKGSLNNIMLVSGSFWTIDTMFYSKPLLNYIMKLVYFYLKGKDLYMYNVGAAVPSMTVNILSKMDIILPDENIRKCFDDKLSLIFNNITNIASQIRILTEARDSLLPKLMRGEIEV